jgi:NADPH:quinone reductase-like Zn-dependent oxidoreductase
MESGQLKTMVYKTLPIEQAEEAHNILAAGGHIGKVVLTVEH